MNLTMKELAAKAGVSQSTVSLVLNGKAEGRISPAKQQLVRQAVKQFGFRPNAAARDLRSGERQLIGVLMCSPRNSHDAEIVRAIQQRLAVRGYLPLFSFWNDFAQVAGAYETVLGRGVDGIIVWQNPISERYREVPTVMYFGDETSPFDDIRLDEEYIARTALEHFRASGHTRIGCCSDPGDRRRAALKRLITAEKLPYHPEWFNDRREDIFSAFASLPERPSAIFASDCLLMQLISDARRAGWRVPEDFSVIGYDDQRESVLISPALTTFRHDPEQVAELLISTLLDRLASPDAPPRRPVLKPQFIVRESCGKFNASSQWSNPKEK